MAKGIGFCGPHRTGKTTLARFAAEDWVYKYIDSSITPVFTRRGTAANAKYTLTERLQVQNEVLAYCVDELWTPAMKAGAPWVADRTPLCFLMYTLADVGPACTEDEAAAYQTYQERCFQALYDYFDMCIHVQPGIPLVFEEGKAPINMGFLHHLNALIRGIASIHHYKLIEVPAHMTGLEPRKALISGLRDWLYLLKPEVILERRGI